MSNRDQEEKRPLMDRAIEISGVYEWLRYRRVLFTSDENFGYMFAIKRDDTMNLMASGKVLDTTVKIIAAHYLNEAKINRECSPRLFVESMANAALRCIYDQLNDRKADGRTDWGKHKDEYEIYFDEDDEDEIDIVEEEEEGDNE